MCALSNFVCNRERTTQDHIALWPIQVFYGAMKQEDSTSVPLLGWVYGMDYGCTISITSVSKYNNSENTPCESQFKNKTTFLYTIFGKQFQLCFLPDDIWYRYPIGIIEIITQIYYYKRISYIILKQK